MYGSSKHYAVPFISSMVFPDRSQGKGALLLSESEDEVRDSQRIYNRQVAILIPLGLLLIIGALVAPLFVSVEWIWMITPFMVGLMILFMGLAFSAISRMRRPTRIYENGIDVQVGKRTIFVSFGEFTQMKEVQNPIEKETYVVFEGTLAYQRAGVRKSTRGLDNILDSISSKIGKPEYVVDVAPTEEEEVASRRLEYAMYATGPIVVAMLTVVFAFPYLISQGMFGYYIFLDQLFILPMAGMIVTAIAPFFMTKMKKLFPRRLNLKIPVMIVIGLLVLFLVMSYVGIGALIAPSPPEENIGPKPSFSVLAPGTYENKSLVIDGNITVSSGESLRIVDSILTMDLERNKDFGIWVEESGTLTLENTTIENHPRIYRYTFEIMGSATIVGCHLIGLWGDPANENFDGGLEIYSSDVLIQDTLIEDATTNGLLIMNSAPRIINNTIEDANDDGMELQNSDATILNNTIEGCGWAMIVSRGSDAVIRGNLISDNKHGIVIEWSSPTVERNEFVGNSNYAIFYDNYSEPAIDENVFVNNERDMSTEGFSVFNKELMTIVTIVVAVICLYIIYRIHRKNVEESL